ncbi:MAG: Cytochrome bd-I ubiquinol oxidase subunit 2 [Chlamydiae bacterium]|nr:Cytochrome bd-I ubiquinol oxidase subunit 2 [Chlamydiota bacterium]
MIEYLLQLFWYIIIITAITFYGMLDGFDLGVGSMHLFTKKDEERRLFLNAISPFWDGNEVWLVIVVGASFAGFPYAYATLFSSFYIPMVALVFSLIFRAVAIEFRSKLPAAWWRKTWDGLFSIASIFIALVLGIILGNLIHGIPLNANHDYTGSVILTFLQPYSIIVGFLVLSLFMMHGSTFLVMKTEGELQQKLKRWVIPTILFFIIVYVATTIGTFVYEKHMIARLLERPYLFFLPLLNLVVIAAIPWMLKKERPGTAFLCSCANIAFLLILFALGTFPSLLRSSVDPAANSLTIFNSASSTTTLTVLAVIVAIGLPLVLAYGFIVYRVFRGKVKLDYGSY